MEVGQRTCSKCNANIALDNPTGECGRHNRLSRTPGNQVYVKNVRSTSPAALAPKLVREMRQKVPENSLNVPGFSYFTKEDRDRYVDFRRTGNLNNCPSPEVILDRFPIKAFEMRAEDLSEFDGMVVAIMDRMTEELVEVEYRVKDECTDGVDMWMTSDGNRFAVTKNRSLNNGIVTVVAVDDDLIVNTLR